MRVWKLNQTGAQAFLGYLAQPTVETERLFLQQSFVTWSSKIRSKLLVWGQPVHICGSQIFYRRNIFPAPLLYALPSFSPLLPSPSAFPSSLFFLVVQHHHSNECSSEGGEGRKVAQKDGIFFNKELSGYINCYPLLLAYIYIISVKFHNNFCPNCYFFLSARKELSLESLWILFNGSQKINGSSENVNPSLERT